MTDPDVQRDRLEEVGEHIAEAEAKAQDLLEPHATPEGGVPSMEDDEPGEQEHVPPGA